VGGIACLAGCGLDGGAMGEEERRGWCLKRGTKGGDDGGMVDGGEGFCER